MSASTTPPAGSDVPAATRARTPGWRDPRLWVGVLIVAVSVVVGVRLVGGADDSVAVWSVAEDLGVGDSVVTDDLLARQVRFVDAGDLDRYLLVDQPLPEDLQLSRAVGAGELLPRAALGGAETSDVVEVPLPVADTGVPASVESGSVVDVLVARPGGGGNRPAEQVLDDVVVVEAPGSPGELGADELRRVVVGVPDEQAEGVEAALGGVTDGSIFLTRVPSP